jgi:hypothetical protein
VPGHRGPPAQLLAVSAVLDHHVARRFQRRAVDHDVAADQQPGAGERQPPVGGDELVGRCPATVGQMLAGRGLREPVRQGNATAQGKWLGQRIAPVTRSILIHLSPPFAFVVCRTCTLYSKSCTQYSCQTAK